LCLKCTKNGKAPLKLWFESSNEMEILSRKDVSLRQLFKLLDVDKISILSSFYLAKKERIDTLELFSVIILALPSDLELKLGRNFLFIT